MPFDPELVLPFLAAGDRRKVGSRVAQFLVGVLEEPGPRARATGIVRAAASEPTAAALIRELIETRVLAPIARALESSEPELRASLAGSQIVGLVMARYVVGVEPLASLPREPSRDRARPTLQRYLVERLDPGE